MRSGPNLIAMASNLIAMAFNLIAMASNLLAARWPPIEDFLNQEQPAGVLRLCVQEQRCSGLAAGRAWMPFLGEDVGVLGLWRIWQPISFSHYLSSRILFESTVDTAPAADEF